MNMTESVFNPTPFERNSIATGVGEKDVCYWSLRNNSSTSALVMLSVCNKDRTVSPSCSVEFSGDSIVEVFDEYLGLGDGEEGQTFFLKNVPKVNDLLNSDDSLVVWADGSPLVFGVDYLFSVSERKIVFDSFTPPEGCFLSASYKYDDPMDTPYTYLLVSYDSHGISSPSSPVTLNGPAALGGSCRMTITWELDPLSSGYWLYRRVSSRLWEVVDRDITDCSYVDVLPFWPLAQGVPSVFDSGVLFNVVNEELPPFSVLESESKLFLDPSQELSFWSDSRLVELVVTGARM